MPAASAAAASSSARHRARHLYRALLRAHQRHLPTRAMQELGNAYVRHEFRQLHRTAAQPQPEQQQAERFLAEWDRYLQQLRQTARARDVAAANGDDAQAMGAAARFGRDLPPELQLSQEQEAQLEKLRNETARKGGGSY